MSFERVASAVDSPANAGEVFTVFLKLGVTAFGGPIAHLGYFRDEIVVRRRWLSEETYAQIIALTQLLPGPASSQVGMILGVLRAGFLGGVAAWVGFTIPSAVVLTLFAMALARLPPSDVAPWLHGILVAAVAVVAFAVTSMANALCTDRARRTLALVAASVVLLAPVSGLVQLALILGGGLFGWRYLREPITATVTTPQPAAGHRFNRRVAIVCGIVFVILLAISIATRGNADVPSLGAVFAKFFETGSLVFGGGHVVLPMLQARVLPNHWVDPQTFLAGYGAAQAIPGPLFTFAAFLGAAIWPDNALAGAALCLGAIYLPSFLLIAAVLPFWNRLRNDPQLTAVLRGVNAVVVGILLAALYTPIWTSAINGPSDVALALIAFLALAVWRIAPWLVVLCCSVFGYALSRSAP